MTKRSSSQASPVRADRKARLYERVFDDLAGMILSGTWAADQVLPNDQMLTQQYGVSRTVIREAVQALASKGLVTVRHGSGTYVNSPEKWEILDPDLLRIMETAGVIIEILEDLLDVRRILEAEAVALAAQKATEAQIAELEQLVEKMNAATCEPERYLELDIQFHIQLMEASNNRVLGGLRRQLSGLLALVMGVRQKLAPVETQSISPTMHQIILRGIRERRPERAKAALLTHVQGAERTIRELREGGTTLGKLPEDKAAEVMTKLKTAT